MPSVESFGGYVEVRDLFNSGVYRTQYCDWDGEDCIGIEFLISFSVDHLGGTDRAFFAIYLKQKAEIEELVNQPARILVKTETSSDITVPELEVYDTGNLYINEDFNNYSVKNFVAKIRILKSGDISFTFNDEVVYEFTFDPELYDFTGSAVDMSCSDHYVYNIGVERLFDEDTVCYDIKNDLGGDDGEVLSIETISGVTFVKLDWDSGDRFVIGQMFLAENYDDEEPGPFSAIAYDGVNDLYYIKENAAISISWENVPSDASGCKDILFLQDALPEESTKFYYFGVETDPENLGVSIKPEFLTINSAFRIISEVFNGNIYRTSTQFKYVNSVCDDLKNGAGVIEERFSNNGSLDWSDPYDILEVYSNYDPLLSIEEPPNEFNIDHSNIPETGRSCKLVRIYHNDNDPEVISPYSDIAIYSDPYLFGESQELVGYIPYNTSGYVDVYFKSEEGQIVSIQYSTHLT